ncbi:MAG: hypothetical protein KGI38_01675 [Thaumarchaeota archaeon]|nr:hypothetical protein [Nitrososphaerota archaeon]
MSKSAFPNPRYPRFRRVPAEELLRKIERLVAREALEGMREQPHVPRYDVKAGEKVLLVALTEFDSEVVKGYADAMKARGASVDVLLLDSTPAVPPDLVAVEEANGIEPLGEMEVVYTRMTNLMNPNTVSQLVQSEGYDLVVSGTAGPLPRVPYRWTRMEYISQEEFASPQAEFPQELQTLIDRKVYEAVRSCEKVRITDPEGTDISLTNYDDKRPMAIAHEYGKPINIGFGGVEDCTGVIAGTLNHLGAFPNCRAHLKDGLVVKVEGGGRYGEAWREKIEKYNAVDFPEFPARTAMKLPGGSAPKIRMPGPGFFWYWECAIGTIPGVFRLRDEGLMKHSANFLHDRKRAGYLHHGFGGSSNSAPALKAAGLPWTHVHLHNMFPTYEGRTRDGASVKVIDRGHLTALDDPEVRMLASKWGDPVGLLSECWIPAVPGINREGRYEDYAEDPAGWIRRDAEAHPILE